MASHTVRDPAEEGDRDRWALGGADAVVSGPARRSRSSVLLLAFRGIDPDFPEKIEGALEEELGRRPFRSLETDDLERREDLIPDLRRREARDVPERQGHVVEDPHAVEVVPVRLEADPYADPAEGPVSDGDIPSGLPRRSWSGHSFSALTRSSWATAGKVASAARARARTRRRTVGSASAG